MDMKEWTKRFLLKLLNKIEDHVVAVVAGVIISIGSVLCIVCWGWLKNKQTLELYSVVWLLFIVIFLFLFVYFIRSIVLNKERLKHVGDITSGIDNWFNKKIDGAAPIIQNRPYYFADLERDLNLKCGSSLKYLPMIAFEHGYAFEMGKKTFKLSNLTPEKDPRKIFEKHYKPIFTGEGKEISFSCKDIDRKLGWPKGATKLWLLSRPHSNEEFEIRDEGRDKIRIVQKK